MHAHTHTHIHTHICTYAHSYTYTGIRTYTHFFLFDLSNLLLLPCSRRSPVSFSTSIFSVWKPPPLFPCRQPIRPAIFYPYVPFTLYPNPHLPTPLRSLHRPFLCAIQARLQSVSLPTRVPFQQCPVTSGFPRSATTPSSARHHHHHHFSFPTPTDQRPRCTFCSHLSPSSNQHPFVLFACLSSIPIIYPARYLHILTKEGLALIFITFFPPKLWLSFSSFPFLPVFLNLK